MVALVGLIALTAFAGVGYAGLSGESGVIHGCVKKKSGSLRIVGAGNRCRRGEKSLSFNQEGPQGPAGAPGPAGAGQSAQTVVDSGSCDDIQTAIDGLPAGGGAVLMAAGTYSCDGSIVIDRDNVSLRGVGPATVLKLAPSVNRPVLIAGQTIESPTATRRHLEVRDLTIDGNRSQQQFQCSSSDCVGADYLRNNGISLRGVEDVLVENVTVESARSGGLVVEKVSRRVTVRDFTAFDNAFDGIAGYETENSLFTGLNLHDNVAAGLSFDLDFNHNTITDSVIADNGDVGIFMRNARENVFSDLRIRDSYKDGIYLAENNDTLQPALGNNFEGLVISGSGAPGAPATEGFALKVVDASCTDNLVVGTQFVDNRDGDISEASPGLVEEFATITR